MKVTVFACVNLVLAAALLLTPFLVGLTTSTPYDPWADLDEDGDIDIFDIVKIAGSYGTTGNPGKNVTLVGRTNKLAFSISTVVKAGDLYATPWIIVDGYSKATVCIYTWASVNTYKLQTSHLAGPEFDADAQSNIGPDFVKTYDVPNEQVQVLLGNGDAYDKEFILDVYLIP